MIALQSFTDYVKCHFFHEFSVLFLVLMASKGSSIILQSPVTKKSNFLVEKWWVIYSRLVIFISVSEYQMSKCQYASPAENEGEAVFLSM